MKDVTPALKSLVETLSLTCFEEQVKTTFFGTSVSVRDRDHLPENGRVECIITVYDPRQELDQLVKQLAVKGVSYQGGSAEQRYCQVASGKDSGKGKNPDWEYLQLAIGAGHAFDNLVNMIHNSEIKAGEYYVELSLPAFKLLVEHRDYLQFVQKSEEQSFEILATAPKRGSIEAKFEVKINKT